METLIGTALGALIAGAAMLINSYYSNKQKQEAEKSRNLYAKNELDIKLLSEIY